MTQTMKVDIENQIISFSCASEKPFPRYDRNGNCYQQILVMDNNSIKLQRLKGGASILKNHDSDDILGIVKDAWIDNKKLYVKAQFRKNDEKAVTTFKDIVDGTVKNVSLGYTVDDVEYKTINGELFGYTKCTPFEVSVAVGVPADESVGFYRSFDTENQETKTMNEEIEIIETEDTAQTVQTEETETKEHAEGCDCAECQLKQKEAKIAELEAKIAQLEAVEQTVEAAEDKIEDEITEQLVDDTTITDDETNDNAEQIIAAAKVLDAEDKVEDALKRNIDVQQFIQENKQTKQTKQTITMKDNDMKFDKVKAFRSLLGAESAIEERNMSAEAYTQAGLAVNHNAIVLRNFDGTNAAGIAQAAEYRADNFVEALRSKMAVDAKFISGVTGNIQIPNQTGVSTVGWTNGSVSATSPQVDMLTLTPRRLGAYVDVDRNLLCNGSLDAINLVVDDLLAQIARKLDETILKGNADPKIVGVGTATGVNTVDFEVANATWKNMLDFQGAVGSYDLDGLKFIMSAADKATLKSIPKAAGTVAGFLCEDDYINGYPVAVCGGLTSGQIYFGNFEKFCIVGEWLRGMQITVDQVSLAYQGLIRVTGMAMMDVAIANPQGFVKRGAVDASNSSSSSKSA